ncbi:hypothetical protein ABB45_11760 (plasmid) [Companilactobacillus farciminis]|nr:hypothetical protein ABB45_11760 [Companilactobacillus farciminis]
MDNSTEMKLSIIIPHFNYGFGVKKILKSIQSSSFDKRCVEILFVDDKSDQKKINELRESANKFNLNVKIIENRSKYKGAGICRNIGLDNASGKWIIFADSDDHFVNDFYSKVSKYFDSKYDMVYFPPTSTDELGNIGSRHVTYISYFGEYLKNNDADYLKYSLTVIWSRMYKKDFLNNNNIRCDNDLVSNDVMFAVRAGLYSSDIKVDDNIIYSWDFNSHSITTSMSREKFLINVKVFIKSNRFLKDNLNMKLYKKIKPSSMKYIAMSYFRFKYGFNFTCKVISLLLKGGALNFSPNDLKSIGSFFKNNQLYGVTENEK